MDHTLRKTLLALGGTLAIVAAGWWLQDRPFFVQLFRGVGSQSAVDISQAPPQTFCLPATATITSGENITLTASGGNPSMYAWRAPQGSPVAGSGASFTVTFATPGAYPVVLISGDPANGIIPARTDRCDITVLGNVSDPILSPSPSPSPSPEASPTPTP
ncbi:MAG: PKD domain-containing protein [Patescibacteria group bacterium]